MMLCNEDVVALRFWNITNKAFQTYGKTIATFVQLKENWLFMFFPEKISALVVRAYFEDIQLCFNTSNYTTSWQHLASGILAGCTVSMAMEVILRASKWVVGGERLQDGTRLPPIQGYMDDMTTLTTTAPCTRRLLTKLTVSL